MSTVTPTIGNMSIDSKTYKVLHYYETQLLKLIMSQFNTNFPAAVKT